MPFIDFDKLSKFQQASARRLRPSWKPDEFHRFAFFVNPTGDVSRKLGNHKLTEAASREMLRKLDEEQRRIFAPAKSKGDLTNYSSAKFTFAPESRRAK